MNECFECGHLGEFENTTAALELSCGVIVEEVRERCPGCGEVYVGFDRPEELFREVAKTLARADYRLAPSELKWLRKYLGYSQSAWGNYLEVARETVSRWESDNSKETMPLATERLLRMLSERGPQTLDYGVPQGFRKRAGRQSAPVIKKNSQGDWCRQ